MENWKIDSWRDKTIKQQPEYPDRNKLRAVCNDLKSYPPLVSADEILALREELAEVSFGNAFLLQGGDCAESFAEFGQNNLSDYFRVILQMTMALMFGAGLPVVKVGRIAGQFAKPRSQGTEEIGGVELPSYRGDIINNMDFTPESRVADPERLLRVYFQSCATLNYLRTLSRGSFAALNQISRWNANFLEHSPQRKRFSDLVGRIDESMRFLRACDLSMNAKEISEARFYTSHEALLLDYEEALTRCDESGQYFCGSAHMLWIGDRTRNPDEAHVEFLRGLINPIGIKVGPSTDKEQLVRVLDLIDHEYEPGKITLISRMGAGVVADKLPAIIEHVEESGHMVIWSCDPMHGNTIKSPNGYKTRRFNDILAEIKGFFDIHKAHGTIAGGVHFEMTGQDVTECLGGAQAISEIDLRDRYHTHCDPRLNGSQAIELAFLIAEELQKGD